MLFVVLLDILFSFSLILTLDLVFILDLIMSFCPNNKVAELASFWFFFFEDRLEKKKNWVIQKGFFMQANSCE